MAERAIALVQTGPEAMEFEEFPLVPVPEGGALIRVEANGLCHTDVDHYRGIDPGAEFPRILGHEIVGVVEDLGVGAVRDDVRVGDRVALNPFVPCTRCRACLRGDGHMCLGDGVAPRTFYGKASTRQSPSLWGGYATHVYAVPGSLLYRFPSEVDARVATLWNPLAGAIQWLTMNARPTPGDVIVVLGSGQRGLACVSAARLAKAGLIVATGLSRDAHKLDVARQLGADIVVDVEREDIVEAVRAATGGAGADIVVDTTPGAIGPLADAIAALRSGGTLVTVGLKNRDADAFPIDQVTRKNITLRGSAGQSHDAYRRAAELIARGEVDLTPMQTHVFGFDRLARAMQVLVGADSAERGINVVVTPSFSGDSDPAGK